MPSLFMPPTRTIPSSPAKLYKGSKAELQNRLQVCNQYQKNQPPNLGHFILAPLHNHPITPTATTSNRPIIPNPTPSIVAATQQTNPTPASPSPSPPPTRVPYKRIPIASPSPPPHSAHIEPSSSPPALGPSTTCTSQEDQDWVEIWEGISRMSLENKARMKEVLRKACLEGVMPWDQQGVSFSYFIPAQCGLRH